MAPARKLILVTRPIEEAGRTRAALEAKGFDVLVDPLLAIEPVSDPRAALGDLDAVTGLLFTSVNGVRAFAEASPRRDLPVYAVGPTTAEAARTQGFAKVETAEGDSAALARLVLAKRLPDQGELLHPAGETVAGDLAGRLQAEGYAVRRVALYRANPASSLGEATRDTLAQGQLNAALFFSPRTARTFVRLARTAGLAGQCRAVWAICLSPAVAQAAEELDWAGIAVVTRPEEGDAVEAMIASLGRPERTEAKSGGSSRMVEDEPKEPGGQAGAAIAIPAAEVIQRFGGIRPMAAKMGISFSTVQGWKERNQIPANRHGEIQALADRLAISLAPGAASAPVVDAVPDAAVQPAPDAADRPVPESAIPAAVASPGATTAPAAASSAAASTAASTARVASDDPPPIPPRLPPQVVPAERSGLGVAGVAFISIVVVAIGLGAAYATRSSWMSASSDADLGSRLAKLEKDVASRPATPAPAAADPKLAQDLAALAKKAGDIEAAIVSAKRDQTQASDQLAAQVKALAPRLDALEKGTDPQAFIAIRNGLNDLGQKLDALAKRVDQIEKAAASARAQGVADAALSLAVAQLRRAIDAGQPFPAELAAARSFAGDDAKIKAALDVLEPHAQNGVATRGSLAAEFPIVADRVLGTAAPREEGGWKQAVLDRLDALIKVRPVGAAVEGETAQAKVARAEALASRGDLQGAIGELAALEGPPAAAAKPWIDRVKARLAALQALAALEAQATQNLAAKAKAAP